MTAFSSTNAVGLFTTWLSREFVKALEFELQYYKFSNKTVVPMGSGKIGQVNTFQNPPGTQTPLTEGSVTGNEITFTTNTAAVTIAEYGEFMPMTQLADYAAVEGTRQEIAKRMSYGARLAIDGLILTKLTTAAIANWYSTLGAPVQGQSTDPNGSPDALVGGSASTLIGASSIARGALATGTGGVQGFRGVPGHPDGDLAAILTPRAELDMVTEVTTGRMTWTQAVTNVPGRLGQEKAIEGYMGSVYGTACYRTQNYFRQTRGGTSASATHNYILGDGAIAAMTFSDMQPQVFINTPSSTDVGNPYRNTYTLAWHVFFGVSIGPGVNATTNPRAVRYYTAGL